jgi:probable rRNA maturation factor
VKVEIFLSGGSRPSPALRRRLEDAVALTFRREKVKPTGDLNLILTDRAEIRRLNKEFLDETGDTDVIAFPYERERGDTESPFGDVYIAVPVARENALRFGDDPEREMVRLAVHGTLHLLGYDDHSPRDRKEMWDRQEAVVARITGKAAKK